jgi:predicted transcriptional regulator
MSSPLATFIQGLKGKNIGVDEIPQILQTCYEVEEEENLVANKVETTEGFWRGGKVQHLLLLKF